MPRAHKTLHAEDTPRFDENRGMDRFAGTSKVGIVGCCKAHRVQTKGLPFRRRDSNLVEFMQGRADRKDFGSLFHRMRMSVVGHASNEVESTSALGTKRRITTPLA